MQLKLVLEPDESGGYVVHVPALRGCWSQGESREEAIDNIREAIDLWLESQAEMSQGDGVPRGEVTVLAV